MSISVVCYPISDLGPNDGQKIGAATAHGCLAQDPKDDDTTRIKYSAAMQQNVCGVDWSPVPDRSDIISVKVRWAEAGTAIFSAAQGGLRDIVTGNNNYGPLRTLPPHGYQSFDETFLTNPENGAAWTVASLADLALAHLQGSLDSELQYPRLTALVAIVTYNPAPEHNEASGESRGDAAAVSGGGVQAGAVDLAPSGSPQSLAQQAIAIRQSQASSGLGQALTASAARRSMAGAGTSIAGCTAKAASLAPTGQPSSLGPVASVAWLQPKIGGAE